MAKEPKPYICTVCNVRIDPPYFQGEARAFIIDHMHGVELPPAVAR